MIEDITIENNKVVRKQKPMLKSGSCKPCFSKTSNLWYKQVVPTTTFKSKVTLKTYQIFYQLNCRSSYYYILIKMFKISVTICWKIRNRIQYKTQQPQKRCHQEGQYTNHQIISTLKDTYLIYMQNVYL